MENTTATGGRKKRKAPAGVNKSENIIKLTVNEH